MRVGILWSGNVDYGGNADRAARLKDFLPLAELPDVQLYSLQKGPPQRELIESGLGDLIIDCDDHDFAETAALIKALDLIIMTDSAVAHIAGALGTPVWVLLDTFAHWYHGFEGDRSDWYPAMRFFRQSRPRHWQDVIARIRDELKEFSKERDIPLGALVYRKRPGIDQDISKLGGGRRSVNDREMGSRPGQLHSNTLIAGHVSPQRVDGNTYFPGRSGAMNTVYGGGRMNTVYAGGRGIMNTVYAGGRGIMNTVYAGGKGIMNTVYAGGKGIMNTVYAGGKGIMNTVYAGGKGVMNTAYGGTPGNPAPGGHHTRGVSQIVTRNITHPSTRQLVSVTYNQVTGLYLDHSGDNGDSAGPTSASFNVTVEVGTGDAARDGPATIGWLLDPPESQLVFVPPRRLRSGSGPRSHAKSVTACPAVLGLENRLFEVVCPVDLTLELCETDFGETAVRNVDGALSAVRDDALAHLVHVHAREEWRHPDRPMMQLRLPYVFLADEPVYMSQLPPFLHFAETPAPGLMIPGRFPINVWPRTLTWAFEWHDTGKPLVLRRGTPLFYLMFEVFPQSRAVQLVEAERTPELEAYLREIQGVVNYAEGAPLMTPILIEIGPGELCDRLSILSLKAQHLERGSRLSRIAEVLDRLRSVRDGLSFDADIIRLESELVEVNRELWEVEDALHAAECRKVFGDAYIALARRVQKLNTRRSELKAAIDAALDASGSVEVALETVKSLIGLTQAFQHHGLAFSFDTYDTADQVINRNHLMSKFLTNSAYSHMLMLDSDMDFTPDAVWRLIAFGVDFACTAYPQKYYNWADLRRLIEAESALPEAERTPTETLVSRSMTYNHQLRDFDNKTWTPEQRNGFVSIPAAGQGLALVSRKVPETMVERGVVKKYPDMAL
ncbi:flbA, partial [Symbiodinium microadriaticum]